MIRTGDQNNPFQGLNTASDDRDSPPGTFKILENFRLNEQRNALVARGGYAIDVDLPKILYKDNNGGLVSDDTYDPVDLEWVKCHACFYHKVIEPEEKLIRVAICQYSYEMKEGGVAYLLRWLMYPYWDGTQFIDAWKDITPYYIDWYSESVNVSLNTNSNFTIYGYDNTFIPGDNEAAVFDYDIENAFVYIEDHTPLFTTPEVHYAEGDKITGSVFNDSVPNITIDTESAHSNWATNTYGIVRIHKNLEMGKIRYEHLVVRDDPDMFDTWMFSSYVEGGDLVISVNPNKNYESPLSNDILQYPAYRIKMSYINKTFFGNGNLYSTVDHHYITSGNCNIYDKHLVYGFPNYENIIINETEFNGKTFKIFENNPSAGAAYTAAVKNTSYNKCLGMFATTSGTVGGSLDGWLYQISANLDMSIPINDFVFQEYDVHGQYGNHVAFNADSAYWYNQSGDLSTLPGHCRYYNFEDIPVTEAMARYGVAITGDEIGFDVGTRINALLQIHAVYNGYRIGLHNSDNSYDGVLATNPGEALINTNYPILAHPVLIPCKFNRNIESYIITLSIAEVDDDSLYTATVDDGKVVIERSIVELDCDFYLCFESNEDGRTQVTGRNVEYCYAMVEKIDRNKYDNASMGGNSLVLTTNTDYNPLIPGSISEEESVLFGYREGKMRKDYSFGGNIHTIMRGRHFMADAIYHEYQQGELSDDTYKEKRVVWYSDIGEFGSSYHLFDANTRRIWTTDIGIVTGLGIINFPQGIGQALMEDRNNLLILCEEGYKFVDLLENDPDTTPFREITYHGDGCIAPDSVVSENGFVFCAGREGIYMFNGYSRIDITKLSLCDITKDWKDLDLDIKKQVKGVYYKPRKWYMLFVPVESDETLIYIFDMEKIETEQVGHIYSDRSLTAMIDLLKPQYIDGNLYIPCEQILMKYDETASLDADNYEIVTIAHTNNVSIDSFKRRISNVKIEYRTENGMTCNLYVDNVLVKTELLTGIVDTSRTIRMNRSTKAGQGRGKRFSVYLSASRGEDSDPITIYDIDFSLIDVPQKRLIRRDI